MKLSRKEKKIAADLKRKEYTNIIILAFLKSADTIADKYEFSIENARNKVFDNWDEFIEVFCKKESGRAHLIRSAANMAKKEIGEIFKLEGVLK